MGDVDTVGRPDYGMTGSELWRVFPGSTFDVGFVPSQLMCRLFDGCRL